MRRTILAAVAVDHNGATLIAARLAFHARRAHLRLQASWPWATDLTHAFARLDSLPEPAG